MSKAQDGSIIVFVSSVLNNPQLSYIQMKIKYSNYIYISGLNLGPRILRVLNNPILLYINEDQILKLHIDGSNMDLLSTKF